MVVSVETKNPSWLTGSMKHTAVSTLKSVVATYGRDTRKRDGPEIFMWSNVATNPSKSSNLQLPWPQQPPGPRGPRSAYEKQKLPAKATHRAAEVSPGNCQSSDKRAGQCDMYRLPFRGISGPG